MNDMQARQFDDGWLSIYMQKCCLNLTEKDVSFHSGPVKNESWKPKLTWIGNSLQSFFFSCYINKFELPYDAYELNKEWYAWLVIHEYS